MSVFSGGRNPPSLKATAISATLGLFILPLITCFDPNLCANELYRGWSISVILWISFALFGLILQFISNSELFVKANIKVTTIILLATVFLSIGIIVGGGIFIDQYFSVGMAGNKMIFCVNGFKP